MLKQTDLEDVIIGINDTDITDFTFTQVRCLCVWTDGYIGL